MRSLLGGLIAVLAICLALRLAAWLVEPVIPLLVVLAALIGLLVLVLGRRGLS